MKYRLLNEWGNRVIYTDNEREKNTLLDKGFHIDKEYNKPKRKAAVKNENKNRAEGDI